MSFVDNMIDFEGGIFLNLEFGTKFLREIPLFLEIPEFLCNAVYDRLKEAPMPKSSWIRSAVLIEPRLVTNTDRYRQTDRLKLIASTALA